MRSAPGSCAVSACIALFASACADPPPPRVAPQLVEQVQVSKREPGLYCRSLGAIEASSECCDLSPYESAYASLRGNAALRGANYVVIDLVHGPAPMSDSSYSRTTVIAGRLFQCPLGGPYAGMRMPLPPPLPPYDDPYDPDDCPTHQ
jgi:hypothetical protein